MNDSRRLRTQRLVHPIGADRAGYTLIEVVISTLIVGGVLVGALNVLGGSVQTRRLSAARIAEPGLGMQLMAEILAQPYEDVDEPAGPIGLETGESNVTRADFDDIDDYNLWSSTSPEYRDGSTISGLTGWTRAVTVKFYDPATGATTTADTGVKLIAVTLVPPSGPSLELHALRCKWGALEQPPAVDTPAVTFIEAELQIGSGNGLVRSGTPIPNHASGP